MSLPDSSQTSRRELREALNQALHSDADFTAFCIDYFPAIHKRLSPSMDRQQKLNLLLELSSPAALASSLSEATRRLTAGHDSPAPAPPGAPRSTRWRWALVAFSLIPAVYLFSQYDGLPWRHMSGITNSITSTNGLQQGYYITSNPTAADIICSDTERVLGKTPFAFSRLRCQSAIVIKKTGYLSSTIEIPQQPRSSFNVNLMPDSSFKYNSVNAQSKIPLIY
jgi:hypothetical protein